MNTLNNLQTLNGIKVFITPDIPKRQLSEDCPVSPEFRIEINKWMIEFFGMTNRIDDDKAIIVPGKSIHVNPRMWAQLNR